MRCMAAGMDMGLIINRLLDFVRSLFHRAPVKLAIVRRYADANGSYVGELYIEGTIAGVSAYRMIGASLDSFPLNASRLLEGEPYYAIDTDNDFLAPMPPIRIRVGAMDPRDNDAVRRMVGRLPRRRMTIVIQNRFIEHVLDRPL
jgi:hypothetical protein